MSKIRVIGGVPHELDEYTGKWVPTDYVPPSPPSANLWKRDKKIIYMALCEGLPESAHIAACHLFDLVGTYSYIVERNASVPVARRIIEHSEECFDPTLDLADLAWVIVKTIKERLSTYIEYCSDLEDPEVDALALVCADVLEVYNKEVAAIYRTEIEAFHTAYRQEKQGFRDFLEDISK